MAGHPPARTIAVVLMALAASGCSFVPVYHRPQVPAARDWAASDAQGSVTASPTVRAGWWHHFASPELDRLMAQGLLGSFTLQAAIARVRQAEGAARIAAAPLLPAVSATGTIESANLSSNNSKATRQIVAQASYELDFWGKNRAAAASGAALAQASAFDAATAAMTLSASVANGYFAVLSLRERIDLARQQAQDARQTLHLIQVQRAAGTATDLQLRQQETSIAALEAAVPALEQQRDASLHALAVLTGQAPEGFTVGDAALADVARPAVSPDLPPQLLALRPDVEAAEARLRSANFDIGVARAAFFPSLSLSANGGLAAASASHVFPPAVLTNVGAGLLAPLFQGGQLAGQLKVSRAKQVEMVATYRQTVLTAFQDVEDALGAVAHVRAQAAIEQNAVSAAQQAATLARTQYRLGSADYLTVLTTQQTLYQTRDALLQLQLQHLQAIVGLCRALGGGFGRPDIVLAPPTAIGRPQ